MSKFCSKCGTEITEGSKYCKKCGAPVEVQSEKNFVVKNSIVQKKKAPYGLLAGIVIAIVVVISLLVKIGGSLGVPDYEKPLKCQIDGINKNNPDKFLSSFTSSGRSYYENDSLKEDLKEIKKISYQVTGTSDLSFSSLLDTVAVLGFSSQDIEDAKALETEIKYKTADGEEGSTTTEFDVVEINGKWYAISSLAN